jgi:DNA-binding response OmpR family regulator
MGLRPTERARILFIEDDPTVSACLTDLLSDEGYEVDAIESALGALDLVSRTKPAVILLDLGLPFASGARLLDDLKANPETADVPVIIVSAMTEILSPLRRAMTAAVLDKPLDATELLDSIRSACLRTQEVGSAPS